MDYTIIMFSLIPLYTYIGLAVYAIGIKNSLIVSGLLGGGYIYANAIQHIYPSPLTPE